jgi:hypothetical protein
LRNVSKTLSSAVSGGVAPFDDLFGYSPQLKQKKVPGQSQLDRIAHGFVQKPAWVRHREGGKAEKPIRSDRTCGVGNTRSPVVADQMRLLLTEFVHEGNDISGQ